ncbi:MAG: B12-binding domain-containing radical SAM protein [Spirochaetes bacterium]|nr:B12-binding domain-containing radical SAM protein [Spirochaetota bacterium]
MTYPPMTLTTLEALVPRDINAEVEICDEFYQKVNYHKHYDIVAISFCTPSAVKAYEIADTYRKSGSHVVLGGYHTTFMPDEALQHADSIIIGAGEVSWPMFLYDFKDCIPKKIYENRIFNPDKFVSPNRSLLKTRKYMKVPTMIANNGCYNKCDYCAIGHMWESNLRPVDKVINEIKRLKTNKLIFFDPNFFQNKDYSMELLKEIEKLKIKWVCNATTADAYDHELMESAGKSGCMGVLLGLESFKKASLKEVNKKINNPDKYKEIVELYHQYGISVNGCFVLGFDSDTEEDLLMLPQQVGDLRLNLARFAILTPFPNSELFNKLDKEGRILTRDWRKYTQNQVVFQPKNITPEKLHEIYLKVWKDTYKFKNIYNRISNMPHTDLMLKFTVWGANIGFKFVGDNIRE